MTMKDNYMKKILIIPDIKNLDESLSLAEKYSLGFEYNDFFIPSVLDDTEKADEIIRTYKEKTLPDYCTLHGAFFDVIPFSPDEKIRDISLMRINQSIDTARKIGASAVVFHTNYNPFLNSKDYISDWIEKNTVIWGKILGDNADVSIYLENMFDTSPEIMSALSEKLSSHENYGVCLDYAHASLSKVPAYEWAEVLGKYVKHIHINDNDLVSDLHLAWGSGKIDKDKFYQAYEKYLGGATILVETTPMENKRTSLEVLKADGFID